MNRLKNVQIIKNPFDNIEYSLHHKIIDNISSTNALWIVIKWTENIDINDWNNDEFLKFIESIDNNRTANFTYTLEQKMANTWVFTDGILTYNVWKSGQLYDTCSRRIVDTSSLKKMHIDIEKFKKTIINKV